MGIHTNFGTIFVGGLEKNQKFLATDPNRSLKEVRRRFREDFKEFNKWNLFSEESKATFHNFKQ